MTLESRDDACARLGLHQVHAFVAPAADGLSDAGAMGRLVGDAMAVPTLRDGRQECRMHRTMVLTIGGC